MVPQLQLDLPSCHELVNIAHFFPIYSPIDAFRFSCTLGMFGVNRFAVLTVDFGAVFLVQFLLLSLFLGIPAMAFYVCLGQYLGSGTVDMWRISPIFQVSLHAS